MPDADLVLTSSRVVTPEGVRPAAVVVAHGTIISVESATGLPGGARHVDAGDAAILPGLVDPHVHVNEPGRTEWEGFATATRAAAAGGVTTIVDMPLNSVPVTTTVAALEAKAACAAAGALVDYGFWGGVVPGNLDDLGPLHAAGALGFKCFLVASGIDEFPALTPGMLRAAMTKLAERRAVLLVHAELPGPIALGTRAAKGADPRRHATYLATRPPAAERDAIELVLRLAGETGCAVHIVHLSSAECLGPIAAARTVGVAVTVETCPHYLTFAAEDIPDGATEYKCAPPVRDRGNREGLWMALSMRHLGIDLVASDHSPCPPDLKRLDAGNFLEAWGGIASLELGLAATWTGARARGHGLGDLARWLAAGPARLAGLEDRKGRITPGHDADLVVFEPDAALVVDPAGLHQRHPLTPYAGMTLSGRVRQTFLRGRCVYDRGTFAAAPLGHRLGPEAV